MNKLSRVSPSPDKTGIVRLSSINTEAISERLPTRPANTANIKRLKSAFA